MERMQPLFVHNGLPPTVASAPCLLEQLGFGCALLFQFCQTSLETTDEILGRRNLHVQRGHFRCLPRLLQLQLQSVDRWSGGIAQHFQSLLQLGDLVPCCIPGYVGVDLPPEPKWLEPKWLRQAIFENISPPHQTQSKDDHALTFHCVQRNSQVSSSATPH